MYSSMVYYSGILDAWLVRAFTSCKPGAKFSIV